MAASINIPAIPTNTLIFTDFENHHFEETFLLKLRAQTETFGSICFFSPIKTFHRIFVVYHSTFDAQRAKALLHNTRFNDITLRVYFGQHTELSIDPEKHYLHLPDQVPSSPEKSGLMSPPGSPPVGHVDDQDMEAIDEFSLDSPTTIIPATTTATTTNATPISNTRKLVVVSESSKLTPQIGKLRIDTLRSSLASSLTPHSPITPTRLAFSPAAGKDEQPFITIQEWGVQAAC